MKIFGDTIGNRTRDLPGCGAVPLPTAPPRDGEIPLQILTEVVTVFGSTSRDLDQGSFLAYHSKVAPLLHATQGELLTESLGNSRINRYIYNVRPSIP